MRANFEFWAFLAVVGCLTSVAHADSVSDPHLHCSLGVATATHDFYEVPVSVQLKGPVFWKRGPDHEYLAQATDEKTGLSLSVKGYTFYDSLSTHQNQAFVGPVTLRFADGTKIVGGDSLIWTAPVGNPITRVDAICYITKETGTESSLQP